MRNISSKTDGLGRRRESAANHGIFGDNWEDVGLAQPRRAGVVRLAAAISPPRAERASRELGSARRPWGGPDPSVWRGLDSWPPLRSLRRCKERTRREPLDGARPASSAPSPQVSIDQMVWRRDGSAAPLGGIPCSDPPPPHAACVRPSRLLPPPLGTAHARRENWRPRVVRRSAG
jgi:hypothetical protein